MGSSMGFLVLGKLFRTLGLNWAFNFFCYMFDSLSYDVHDICFVLILKVWY
jgi:hypothetical protein